MKITPDTNVLVRAIAMDDAHQASIAQAALNRADAVALTLPTLCELVWVLSQGYKIGAKDIAETIRDLANAASALLDRAAVEAGLEFLEAGGDFADGAIAYEGRWLGGETFVSFDRRAVKLLGERGKKARLLS